jgi:hypothetical protein
VLLALVAGPVTDDDRPVVRARGDKLARRVKHHVVDGAAVWVHPLDLVPPKVEHKNPTLLCTKHENLLVGDEAKRRVLLEDPLFGKNSTKPAAEKREAKTTATKANENVGAFELFAVAELRARLPPHLHGAAGILTEVPLPPPPLLRVCGSMST